MSTAKNKEQIKKDYIYSGIVAGAERVSSHREKLNESNGYPVPDRDTGNNLAYLMHYVVSELKSSDTIHDMMTNVSNAAIMGARGNSGAIFSQFFYGFKTKSPRSNEMSVEMMIDCFESGYDYAYKAIKQPVEGTIVTAIRGWVEGLKLSFKGNQTLRDIHLAAFNTLKETVALTQYTLPQQRKIQAEDAGAKAFLYFIEGFMQMIIDKVSHYNANFIEAHHLPEIDFADRVYAKDDPIEFRFCTEVLLKKSSLFNKTNIDVMLGEYGNSIVLSQNTLIARVHLHTNTPSQVVEQLSHIGHILEVKADDMKMQQLLSYKHKGEIALVIDSIADIAPSKLPDFVYQLPLNLLVDNVTYKDKRTVFADILKSKKASSSQPNHEQVKAFLAPIIQCYDKVIILTVSSKMSGVYERFKEVVESYNDTSIALIDTKVNSVAEGLLVFKAIEMIRAGLSFKTVIDGVKGLRSRAKIIVSVPNLKAMVASGRLNEKVGWLLQKIGFLPLITINEKGEGAIKGVAFSQEKNMQLLYKIALENKDNIEHYALVHAGCLNKVKEVAQKLEDIVGKKPLYIEEISSIVRLFSGTGSIALGYILKET